jgi:hypothetical protein
MRIGVTGHRHLPDHAAWGWVEGVVAISLSSLPAQLVGISSLAIGADQLFADLVLRRGGALYAVLPFERYERSFEAGEDRERYQALLKRAVEVEILSECTDDEQSYMAAGRRIVDRSDRMIAIWDGEKAAGLGGTGDVVEYARSTGKEIIHIDPVRRITLVIQRMVP